MNFIRQRLGNQGGYLLATKCSHVGRATAFDGLYDTLPTSKAATPSSSLLTVIFVVTPLLAENAIFTCAATLPPPSVFPYSLSVCVLVDIGTSVPSSGCNDRALVSCSVASARASLAHFATIEDEILTCYTLRATQLQCF